MATDMYNYMKKLLGVVQHKWQKSLSGQESVISDSKQVTSCTSMLIAGVMSVSVSTRVLVGG